MNKHLALGKQGEEIAAQYLIKKGFAIIERNWRFRHKEVDIIARDGNDLVFIEVKTRSSDYFGSPEEAVDIRKQHFLCAAAEAYVSDYSPDVNLRFDIISIILKSNFRSIDHIEDAF